MLRWRYRGKMLTTGLSVGRVQAFKGTKARHCNPETKIHALVSEVILISGVGERTDPFVNPYFPQASWFAPDGKFPLTFARWSIILWNSCECSALQY